MDDLLSYVSGLGTILAHAKFEQCNQVVWKYIQYRIFLKDRYEENEAVGQTYQRPRQMLDVQVKKWTETFW